MPDIPFDGPGEWGFSTPQPVTELINAANDGDPTLTSDMTEIYFRSARAGGVSLDDIWYSTRATASDPWSLPARSILSSTEYDNQPRIAPDGRTIWFRRGASSLARLMVSTRATAMIDSMWTAPKVLTEFDATDVAQDAALLSTTIAQTEGYLISKRDPTNLVRIFRTTRATNPGLWGIPPMKVPELVGNGMYEQSPWVIPNQLAIVFDSDRTGCLGGGDIWIATRTSTMNVFGTPICLREVSTGGFEAAPWISPDLRHIYFRSSANGGEIYEAHR